MQYSLLRDETKSKTLQQVSRDKLIVSPFNPRRSREAADIERLAQRIERNGYEITRALWAYPVNGHYEVFAGGNRLEAVKRTSIDTVPVIVHEGFSDDEITGLADQDNENDEYHTPVSIVDVWMDYKRLDELGWNQTRIAKAKGVLQSEVSARIRYASLPASVLREFIKNDSFKESHAAEISKLSNFDNPWLWREAAMLEIIDAAIRKAGAAKNVTAKQIADLVAHYNGFVELAFTYTDKLDADWRDKFLNELIATTARTKPAVEAAYGRIVEAQRKEAQRKAEELARQQNEAEADRLRLEREAEQNRRVAAIMANLVYGDARTAMRSAPTGIKLVLTDPPYGQEFQSNRRVVSAKAPRLANDDGQAFDLLRDVLTEAYAHMADDSTLLVWSSWRYECEFRQVVTDCGFTIKGSLIWDKPNHGSGDLDGSFAPKHERIIHAVKGNPKLNRRHDDVLRGSQFLGTDHPTEKPLDLLALLIEATTNEGEIVADPFAGGGSTPVAAYKARRQFWACELDDDWHKAASSKLYDLVKG